MLLASLVSRTNRAKPYGRGNAGYPNVGWTAHSAAEFFGGIRVGLYCISVFLENKNIIQILKTCDDNKFKYKKLEITDQTEETVAGYQIDIAGLKILVLPCNEFHKNKDFEIGITEKNKEQWKSFIKNCNKNTFEIKGGTFKDDETEYAVIKDKRHHGPFFFIFDGHHSEEDPLVKIKCIIVDYDYQLYNEKIKDAIGNKISEKLEIKSGNKFEIDEITVKLDGKIKTIEI